MDKESTCIGHAMNAFDGILNADKKNPKATPQSESPPNKQNGQYNLNIQKPNSKQEVMR